MKKNFRVWQLLATALLLSVRLLRADEVGAERIMVLDSCEYPSEEAARAAWIPAEEGTPPLERLVQGGQSRLALPLNFETNDTWRVVWDLKGNWDLSSCQKLRLHVRVEDERPAAMMLYLHSGTGWYGVSFAAVPDQDSVELLRRRFFIEDEPGGWDRVDCIRVAVRREDGDGRHVILSGIDGVSRPAKVALYRNDSGIKVESTVPTYVDRIGAALDRLAIAYEIVGDAEVLAGRLEGKTVAILPLNPVLSKAQAVQLEKFVADGGRLIVCYRLPAPLDAWLGVRTKGTLSDKGKLQSFTFEPTEGRAAISAIQRSWIANGVVPETNTQIRAVWIDRDGVPSTESAVTSNRHGFYIGHVLTSSDQSQKDLLLQEMIGELWPGMWQEVCEARVAGLAKIAGYKTEAAVRKAIVRNRASSDNAAAIDERLAEADQREAEAKTALLDGSNLARAADCLARAHEALTQAYATSVPSKADEFRAVWCHSPTGVADMTWDEAIKRLADSGFNAILPNLSWGCSAAYESKVLPRAPGIEGDQLAECLAAAKKYGVAVHVWRVNWKLFWRADAKLVAKLRADGRLQVNKAGKSVEWLCPSNSENQKLELDAMLEIVRNYDVAGIHFDYIRYPGHESCFCPECRKQFEMRQGSVMVNWPMDVTTGSYQQAYLQFRRDNITQLVAAVSEQARTVRPSIQISAAVFPYWTSARDDVGQDWRLWAQRRYLDFVCPMQYTESASLFESETKRSARWIGGNIPLRPGIGATLGLAPDGTLRQVQATRRLADGFVLFNYDRALLDHLDLLRLGATRTKE